jgi:DNA-nicking Smr family endonuclease
MPHTRDDEAPIELPITGELDLHTFRPSDLGELIPAYLDACRAKGIREVRIIHGKGIGTLRTTVHTLLNALPGIAGYRLGNETSGSWGATLVRLESDDTKRPPVTVGDGRPQK